MTITVTLWNNENTDFSSLPSRTTGVLYVVDGEIKSGIEVKDSEGAIIATTGVVWGVPRASDITTGVWSNDKTAKSSNLEKHEILITQQALCVGGISNIYAADIEERRLTGEYYWTNTAMSENPVTAVTINSVSIPVGQRIEGRVLPFPNNGDYTIHKDLVKKKLVEFKEPFKDAARLHLYGEGGTVDPLVLANDSTRTDARFTGVAYATGVFWLNREDPQFRGGTAPDVQLYVEGMKIRTFSTVGVLSTAKTYSNNPAAVLLDYLTNSSYGMGLNDNEVDLPSFFEAWRICEQVVVESVPIAGSYWQYKGTTRSVKLYECNLTLDTSKPIIENVKAILGTMNDASLVWSGGQYKLKLAYPNIWGKSGTASNF